MNAIERIVKASTAAQAVPVRLEDPAAAQRVSVLLEDHGCAVVPAVPAAKPQEQRAA